MKIEDEIKQKTFKSPQHKLAVNLIYTHNWLTSFHSDFFKGGEITLQQYNVLRILRGQYPKHSSLKLIKERMLDRQCDASRLMDKLVAKKFVLRNQCPNDRRSINLLITEKGLDLLKSFDGIEDKTQEAFKNLNKKQIETLNELLDSLRG